MKLKEMVIMAYSALSTTSELEPHNRVQYTFIIMTSLSVKDYYSSIGNIAEVFYALVTGHVYIYDIKKCNLRFWFWLKNE